MIILMFILNITLLNFVIAILSNTYEKIRDNSLGVYLKALVNTNSSVGYHKYYSFMVSANSVINIFYIPFIPIAILCRSKRFNKFLLLTQFIPTFLVGLSTWILISFILTVISYPVELMLNFRKVL